jgi:hypothetical protein
MTSIGKVRNKDKRIVARLYNQQIWCQWSGEDQDLLIDGLIESKLTFSSNDFIISIQSKLNKNIQ